MLRLFLFVVASLAIDVSSAHAEPVSAAIIAFTGATGFGAAFISAAVGICFSRGIAIVRRNK